MRKTAVVLLWVFISLAVHATPGKRKAPVALLDSMNASKFFEAHYQDCGESYYLGKREYERYFRGWQWMLDQLRPDERYEYEIIHDEDLNAAGLEGFQVLILSNDPLFSDAQTRAIQQWVLRGGRLLATFGTSYKEPVTDLRQLDGWKLQKGGTFGLHQLWHDPVGKLFSTFWVDPGVDVTITRYEGPTAPLQGLITDDLLHYGAEANILVQRPENHPNVLGFLVIDNGGWKSTSPAIIAARQAKGLVVYLAFAPEYIVYKELESTGLLPEGFPTCPDPQDWTGRGEQPRMIMKSSLDYLMDN